MGVKLNIKNATVRKKKMVFQIKYYANRTTNPNLPIILPIGVVI